MALPKVVFKLSTIKQEAELFLGFCMYAEEGERWVRIIYAVHPEIKEIIRSGKPAEEIYKELYRYSKSFVAKEKKKIEKQVRDYQKEWNRINDRFLKILAEDFQTEFPRNRKRITAYVSIFPIFPRFLDSWSFNVGYRNPAMMKRVAVHEIIHFMYFKKWKEVFPKTKREEMESPQLVWKLSEILAPVILNNNPKIQNLINDEDKGYPEFKKYEKSFTKLYNDHLKKKTPFEDFLKTSWKEAKKVKVR